MMSCPERSGVPSKFGFRAFTRNSEIEDLISTLVDLYIPIHITRMSGYFTVSAMPQLFYHYFRYELTPNLIMPWGIDIVPLEGYLIAATSRKTSELSWFHYQTP